MKKKAIENQKLMYDISQVSHPQPCCTCPSPRSCLTMLYQ
jgi:hypothetical protein